MLSIFNIVRLTVYGTVIAWSLIVLGLASFLDHLLITNDLTRFVPLSIFIAVCTLLIVPTLLITGLMKRDTVFSQVRTEITFTGLLGLLWMVLAIYSASEPDVIVECDFDGDGDFEESDEYSTDTYMAQYRVVKSFATFNALLLLAFFAFLLVMSLMHHSKGRSIVWASKTTTYPWFGGAPPLPSKEFNVSSESLPLPVTSKFGPSAGKMQSISGTGPMKAGGHYIIYIPPPPGTAS